MDFKSTPRSSRNHVSIAALRSAVPAVTGYPWALGASAPATSACWTLLGTGSTGEPTDRSIMPPGTVLAVALKPAIRDQSYGDEYAWKPMRTPFLDGMFLRYDEPSAVIDRGFNPNYALCAALIRKSAYWFCGGSAATCSGSLPIGPLAEAPPKSPTSAKKLTAASLYQAHSSGRSSS